jgi:hypothetical protein
MTDRSPDQRVADWLRSGPEAVAAEFVDATLRPIPRMRQRRSWRIALERRSWLLQPAALGVAGLLIVGVIGLVGSIGRGPVEPSAPASPTTPTFELRISPSDSSDRIPDTGPYVTDPSATTNTCSRLADGFWRMRYSGGEPYVRLDVIVGPEAAAGGRSTDVSGEIVIGSPLTTLLNFDQPGYRSGDAPGRSSASVETTVDTDRITFQIAATTPRAKVDFTDYPYSVEVDLTIACPT